MTFRSPPFLSYCKIHFRKNIDIAHHSAPHKKYIETLISYKFYTFRFNKYD